jgi:hypothetical protein
VEVDAGHLGSRGEPVNKSAISPSWLRKLIRRKGCSSSAVENSKWTTEENRMAADVYPAEQGVYETVNEQQNASLRWLIAKLTSTFGIPMTEIFRHPVVSRKNPTEAESALW